MAGTQGERKGRDGITQLADGRWQARMTVGYADGKQQRKAVYGKTYAACKEKLTTLLHNRQQGIAPTDDQITVKRYLTDWLTNSAKSTVRPRTYESYTHIVNAHILPIIGKTALTKLTPQQVRALMNAKRSRPCAGCPLTITAVSNSSAARNPPSRCLQRLPAAST